LLICADKETGGLESKALSFHATALSSSSLNITQMNFHLNSIPGQIDLNSSWHDGTLEGSTQTYSRIIANPPFNQPWGGRKEHFYWYAEPPKGNANFGWLQHAIHLLEPDGRAAILMPNSTLFSTNSRELAIRRHMVDEGCVEGIITLPSSMFYNTRIPVCLWLLTPRSDRREVLLIDASAAGRMATRTRRIMEGPEICEIADMVSSWRSGHLVNESQNVGSASLSEVSEKNYNLTPAVHLASAPTIPTTDNSQSLTNDLMNRLLTLRGEADEKDAIADRLLRELKW
jgi:type I restriction enzyme M protein